LSEEHEKYLKQAKMNPENFYSKDAMIKDVDVSNVVKGQIIWPKPKQDIL